MSTQVPRPMFVDNFSVFATWFDSVIKDDSCRLTVSNDGSWCSVGKMTALSETGDAYTTESSDVPTLDSVSPGNISVTSSDFVVSVYKDRSIDYERISSELGTTEGSVSVLESKIPVELENGKAWQHSAEPWDSDFYLDQRTFPGTWGASMQCWFCDVRNMGCGGC